MPNLESGRKPGWRLTWKTFGYALSPALLYTALSGAVYSVLSLGGLPLQKIMLQAVSVAVCLLFFSWRARKEAIRVKGPKGSAYRFPAAFCFVMAAILCTVADNYLFQAILSKFGRFHSDYWRVADAFYRQGLGAEIITLCALAPITEELVYRGFVYQRLRAWASSVTAAVLSAFIFGALHFNAVQFAHAFVIGILLAHIVYKTNGLTTAMAAHMAANLVSVIWTETEILSFLDMAGPMRLAAAAFCLVLVAIFLSEGNRLARH